MPDHQSWVLDAMRDDPTMPPGEPRTVSDRLAEQLWAEHGWSLSLSDVASLLIAVLAAAALMACYA